MECKDCLLKENIRLIDELIKSKVYIKELEIKIMNLEKAKLKEDKEDKEDLFNPDVFRSK